MGLDMYLEKEIYIGAQYPHRGITGKIELFRTAAKGTEPEKVPIKVKFDRVVSIRELICYWRKANAIHKFFVDLRDGVDDCQPIHLGWEQLKELKDKCEQVLANKDLAPEVLPTMEGFFFGGTGYDAYYYDDLKNTVKVLDELSKEEGHEHEEYIYQASW